MSEEILLLCGEEMKSAIEKFEMELARLRTGRANPNILDKIMVDYYGTLTPLKQLSVISVSTATQLTIKPFDKGALKDIEAGINEAQLNLVPNNDGEVIRINFPSITEETRKELVKEVKKISENTKVSIRNIRKESNDSLKKLDGREDEIKGYQEDVQKLTDKFNKLVDEITVKKEKDVMTV